VFRHLGHEDLILLAARREPEALDWSTLERATAR